MENNKRNSKLTSCAVVLFATCLTAAAAYAGGNATTKTDTVLLPPATSIPGVAANAQGRAQIELTPGVRERLKVDIDDVEVISDTSDPAFCVGFYLVVLSDNNITRSNEVKLPDFPGIVAECLMPGQPQGKTKGSLNFDVRLNRGEQAMSLDGKLLSIWEVDVVRVLGTREVFRPANGDLFEVESRIAVALEGVLQR